MGKKFEQAFDEPVRFYPSGYYVSGNAFEVDEAAEVIGKELGINIDIEDVIHSPLVTYLPSKLLYLHGSVSPRSYYIQQTTLAQHLLENRCNVY